MMDLLHFRSVRYAFQKPGFVAGLVAVATTVMATGYHLRFYGNDWLLALPIPIGIGILAWHAAEKRKGRAADEAANEEAARLVAHLQELESSLQAAESAVQGYERLLQERDGQLKAGEKPA